MRRALMFPFCLLLFFAAISLARADDAAPTNASGNPGGETTASAKTITVRPEPDAKTLLRNPAMGWVLYAESTWSNDFPDASVYWQDAAPYVDDATILYIRCTWAQMEPQEGHFAWDENANFQALVQGALDRHLHLAFRVIVDSKDCSQPATPLWVQAAGAKGYEDDGKGGMKLWNPHADDLVFRHKLEEFIAAFAKQYDDPSRVDYIDGGGLGWWGELHHVDTADNESTLDWICGTYANAFHHVLLGLQVGSPLADFGKYDSMVFDKYGYVARIDSLGSSWMGDDKMKELQSLFPGVPFFGESCYFSLESTTDWHKDTRRSLKAPRDVLQAAFDDAIQCHSNTLDLREPHDAKLTLSVAPDLISDFIAQAGYRLYPEMIEYPKQMTAGVPATINHTWKNLAVGVMPNDNVRWGKKYRVAFALIDAADKKVVATAVDKDADPGQWILGPSVPNACQASFSPVPSPGDYQLGVALVNTQNNNTPEIQLATQHLENCGGWTLLGPIHVNPAQ